MSKNFTIADLVSFGNYLLSEERLSNLSNPESIGVVGEWDIDQWQNLPEEARLHPCATTPSLNELRDAIYLNALNKGFYRDQLDILAAIEDTATADEINAMKARAMHLCTAQRIALIHSEVSEALEADRKNRRADLASFNEQVAVHGYRDADFQKYVKDTFEDEVADAIIRLLDLCGMMDIDIERHINLKMQYNASRPMLHGKLY